jgi:upstream activation factor subunit UAF30
VTPEEKSQYTAIIDAILATADLETISRKKIRHGLETSLGGKDLSEQKVAFGFGNFLLCKARIVVVADC